MLKPTELTISGCRVKFPAKPYRSQVAMMAKIISSLQRSQNSLLESPTGSGKSLALLCASLAWQQAEQARVDNFNQLLAQAQETQDPAIRDALMALGGANVEMDEDSIAPDFTDPVTATAPDSGGGFMIPDPDMDDFVDPSGPKPRKDPVKEDSLAYHLPFGDVQMAAAGTNMLKLPKKQKVPTIYFGTRTHKQVAQIVRELKKTGYSHVRMTLLASRDHTCIHPTVSKSFQKTQDCQDLMDKKKGGGCRYQHNVKAKLASHHSLRLQLGNDEAWDLEDIVKVGRKLKCCPYYAVRELRTSARLVICPYNYLVDPKIRKSMEINLQNQIVVLDEAHNIEDSARDAVSARIDIEDIVFAMQDCEKMVSMNVLPAVHSGLADFCSRLAQWMQRSLEGRTDYSDYNSSSRVWTGTAGIAEWNELVFPPSNYIAIKNMLEEAIKEQQLVSEDQEAGFEDAAPAISKKALDTIGDVFMILEYMYTKDALYRDDYRMAVVQTQTRKKASTGWNRKGRNDSTALVKVITLHFWCLNPGVCFDELKDACRSIVLTSGTLSPIVTFASELDVKFPITLETDHVIDRKQVWVGTLSHGPTGHNLNATYKNTETLAFQDEIGKLVRDVCHRVPHGILVFLPSYKMLDNMTQRWQTTGIWADIMTKKAIVSEPKFSDKLDEVMTEFYEAISMNKDLEGGGMDGALFLAVCRGKVSEGLDFADNNARAVICVGIPFPNVKDSLVDLKRKYNDHKRSTQDPNILSGGEWYEIQAFRALNQALGRCIRHRKDWGAILMVDDRYARNERYVNGLSKWVRKNVMHYSSCANMFNNLDRFVKDMKHLEKEEQELQSQAESTQAKDSPGHNAVTSDSSAVMTDGSNSSAVIPDVVKSTLVSQVAVENGVASGWKMKGMANPNQNGSQTCSEVETLSSKLSKLQEFRRGPVTAKFEKQSQSNLDSSTFLNKGGGHLNGLTASQFNRYNDSIGQNFGAKIKNNGEFEDGAKSSMGSGNSNFSLSNDNDIDLQSASSKRKFVSSSGSSDGMYSPSRTNNKPKSSRTNLYQTNKVSLNFKDDVSKSSSTKNDIKSDSEPILVDSDEFDEDPVVVVTPPPAPPEVVVVTPPPAPPEVVVVEKSVDEHQEDAKMRNAFECNKALLSDAIFGEKSHESSVVDLYNNSLKSDNVRCNKTTVMADAPRGGSGNRNVTPQNDKIEPVSSPLLHNAAVKQNKAPPLKYKNYDGLSKSASVKKVNNVSIVNLKASDLLRTDMEDIVTEDSTENQHWSSLIKKRKEKRASREKLEQDIANESVIPDTPEKVDKLEDVCIDWDEDIFLTSDEELTPALMMVGSSTNQNNQSRQMNVTVKTRKPLFDKNEVEATTKSSPVIEKKSTNIISQRRNDDARSKNKIADTVSKDMDKSNNYMDTSLRSECKSPDEWLDDTIESSFVKGKLCKKKKKRSSKDKSFSRLPKLPICGDSDDDFQ